MRVPDQDMAPAWQRQSGTGAGKDFLVLFGNAYQEQDVISMHQFVNLLSFRDIYDFSEKLNWEKFKKLIDYSF